MKKKWLWILCLAMILVLSACEMSVQPGEKTSAPEKEKETSSEKEESSEEKTPSEKEESSTDNSIPEEDTSEEISDDTEMVTEQDPVSSEPEEKEETTKMQTTNRLVITCKEGTTDEAVEALLQKYDLRLIYDKNGHKLLVVWTAYKLPEKKLEAVMKRIEAEEAVETVELDGINELH